MSTKCNTDNIRRYINEHINNYSNILFVYLFGSHSRKTQKPHSDIDIAFYISPRDYSKDAFESTKNAYLLATKIGETFNKQTDVLILNSSSIEMNYHIITTAQIIYSYNVDHRLIFEARIRGMYFDFMPFLEELRRCKSS